MPTGIQTYHLELHTPEPLVFDDSDIDQDLKEYFDNRQRQTEEIIVGYKDYDLKVYRNPYTAVAGKPYIQSWIEIYKRDKKLYDTYRFEPDQFHPDGMILTDLPLNVETIKDPVSAEYKLLDKARAIIDRLDENGSAVLTMCNRGNILDGAEQ